MKCPQCKEEMDKTTRPESTLYMCVNDDCAGTIVQIFHDADSNAMKVNRKIKEDWEWED